MEKSLAAYRRKQMADHEVGAAYDALKEEYTVPWRDCFPAWTDAQLPGVALAGARHKEDLTQVELERVTGIPQRHISEMENGKRPIGKERAKILAKVLKVDYHIFL